MMQRTFGAIVEMEPIVPIGPHPDDLVECSDGTMRLRGDGFEDAAGKLHPTEDDAHEANVELVKELLNSNYEFWKEYETTGDGNDCYYEMAFEDRKGIAGRIKEWMEDNRIECDAQHDRIAETIADDLDEVETEYDPSDYRAYFGKGCCIESFQIGEREDQMDFDNFPLLAELHRHGDLEACLEDVQNCHDCNAWPQKTYNHKSGKRDGYVSGGDYPHIDVSFDIGGQLQFVVNEDRMIELITTAKISICRSVDRNRRGR